MLWGQGERRPRGHGLALAPIEHQTAELLEDKDPPCTHAASPKQPLKA